VAAVVLLLELGTAETCTTPPVVNRASVPVKLLACMLVLTLQVPRELSLCTAPFET
jgi:hypothetical protein